MTDPILQIYTREFDFPMPNQNGNDENKMNESTELKFTNQFYQ